MGMAIDLVRIALSKRPGKTASVFFGNLAESAPVFWRHLQRCIFLDSLDSATNMSFTPSSVYLVVMGVAGCGKSSLGAALAQAEGLPLIEGDDHHSPVSREKMRQGIALTDADREGWLATLGHLLQAQPQGVVLTCSAL